MEAHDLSTKIAKLSINHFNNLPKFGKPTIQEWTILATIICEHLENLTVVSLATGSKCIGANKLCPNGTILNDSHAEILSRRGFLKYLYQQIDETFNGNDSIFVISKNRKCKLKPNVHFHMFTSQVLCGDAAIIPKSEEDIHRTGAKCLKTEEKQDVHDPGDKYHSIGAIRTKPGRGDPTLSVSCSDKMARWIRVGLQGAILMLFLEEPIYLKSIIFPKDIPFSEVALNRALVGRFEDGNGLEFPFKLTVPKVYQVDVSFCPNVELKLCPSSIIWSKTNLEVSVNGRRQGVTKKDLHTEKAEISICKKQLSKIFYKIQNIHKICPNLSKNLTYSELKQESSSYNKNWDYVKTEIFKFWTTKPELKFIVND